MSPSLPDEFRLRIIDVHGQPGALWLEALPGQIKVMEQRWKLEVLPPYPLSYNFVAPANGPNGEAWVLKLGVPNPELTGEIQALRGFNGRGAVKLIHGDPLEGVLLIERIQPGTPLSDIADDEQATRLAARIMKRLWRKVPQSLGLRTIAYLGAGLQRLRQRFDGGCGPFSADLVAMAEATLTQTHPAPACLLHGDLHHDNILFDQRRGWLAIDPAGILGDPGYEVGSLLINPLPETPERADLSDLLRTRLEILSSELDMPLERLRRWGIFKCVLSAWWDFEDHGRGWEPAITVAHALACL